MKTKGMVQASFFVVLMAVGAQFNLTLGAPIPYTLQTFFMLMAGIVLGWKYGPVSQLVYLLLGLFGLPIFAQGKGGLASVMGPTFGFLIGFVLGAYVTGLLFKKLPVRNGIARGVVSALAGAVVIYLPGIAYFYLLENLFLGKVMSLGTVLGFMVPFFVPDAVKAVLAGAFGAVVWKLLAKRGLAASE